MLSPSPSHLSILQFYFILTTGSGSGIRPSHTPLFSTELWNYGHGICSPLPRSPLEHLSGSPLGHLLGSPLGHLPRSPLGHLPRSPLGQLPRSPDQLRISLRLTWLGTLAVYYNTDSSCGCWNNMKLVLLIHIQGIQVSCQQGVLD